MSIYIVLNQKGGTGKSLFAEHLLPEYIRQKRIQDTVKIYKFSNNLVHSQNNLINSSLLQIENIISITWSECLDGYIDALFDSHEEDIIIDLDSGAITDYMFYNFYHRDAHNYIFVIPYNANADLLLKKTIKQIKKNFKNPKIIIVLNQIDFKGSKLEEAKTYILNLYKQNQSTIDLNSLEDYSNYLKAAIPIINEEISLALFEKKSMADLNLRFREFQKSSSNNFLIALKVGNKIKNIDLPYTYKKSSIQFLADSKINYFYTYICEEFFAELRKLESNINLNLLKNN